MANTHPWLAGILQTTDPLFPIGSYAHSYGLEEFVANGDVNDVESLIEYIENVVFLNLQEFELPYLRFLAQAIQAVNFQLVEELDREISASKLSKELRVASASQGVQRLRLISQLRPHESFDTLKRLRTEKRISPNHLTVFAAELIVGSVPLEAGLASWAYQALAAPCAASLKLFRIGQEAAQKALTAAIRNLDSLVLESLSVEREYAGAFLPSLDIASDRHERLFSRLFIS